MATFPATVAALRMSQGAVRRTASDSMPSATEVGVTGSQLDLLLAVRPDLSRALNRAWALAGEHRPGPALRLP